MKNKWNAVDNKNNVYKAVNRRVDWIIYVYQGVDLLVETPLSNELYGLRWMAMPEMVILRFSTNIDVAGN